VPKRSRRAELSFNCKNPAFGSVLMTLSACFFHPTQGIPGSRLRCHVIFLHIVIDNPDDDAQNSR
jgi:hypothetical protein